jgi:hypothetical protein
MYRGINKFKTDYKPRSNLVIDGNDLLSDFYSILNRYRNYFCEVSNTQDVRKREEPTADPLGIEIRSSEAETDTGKL